MLQGSVETVVLKAPDQLRQRQDLRRDRISCRRRFRSCVSIVRWCVDTAPSTDSGSASPNQSHWRRWGLYPRPAVLCRDPGRGLHGRRQLIRIRILVVTPRWAECRRRHGWPTDSGGNRIFKRGTVRIGWKIGNLGWNSGWIWNLDWWRMGNDGEEGGNCYPMCDLCLEAVAGSPSPLSQVE